MTNAPEITVFGFGFGTQIRKHVTEQVDNDPLWCARFLHTHKDAIVQTHLDFLRCGSDLLMTATYQASIDGFMKYLNLSREESEDLIAEGVRLGKKAIDIYCQEVSPATKRPRLVGIVGPYGAAQHDVSEYTGVYSDQVTVETLKQWHYPRLKIIIDAGVDLLEFPTVPCKMEAVAIFELLKEKFPDTKATLTFSVRKDGKSLASGENFQESAKLCYDLNPTQVLAIGVNCLSPKLVESFIAGINDDRQANPLPLIIFANGEEYDQELGKWTGRENCDPLESFVKRWLDLGITWIGTCCRTYPEDVIAIRKQVDEWIDSCMRKQN